MAEYIERTEELMLAMNAGARAIENTRRYHGAVYTKDVFSESPQEIPYLLAAKVLREVSDTPAADVAPVVWIPVTERLPEDRSDVLVVAYWHERWGVYMGWCAPKRAEWSVHIGIGDRNDVAVTHWMPLPEPPKGVTDNG
jgi:hypothetical protein